VQQYRDMPEVEQVFALPYALRSYGLRRFGFHGLSYEYLTHVLPQRHGGLARGRLVAAHLGSGASLCAMHDLRSVATTMGFSALDGLMMGTRCGSLDPGALLYLMQVEALDVDRVARMLYHESGLLGVSGLSSDPRELLRHEHDGGEQGQRVRLALDLYIRRIVRETGALAAVLGGLDMLVFTAGIGEHNAEVRRRVCRELSWLGVELDEDANANHLNVISTDSSRVRVAVEPTNEEWVAARHAAVLLQAPAPR
jgi:acetate kinase